MPGGLYFYQIKGLARKHGWKKVIKGFFKMKAKAWYRYWTTYKGL